MKKKPVSKAPLWPLGMLAAAGALTVLSPLARLSETAIVILGGLFAVLAFCWRIARQVGCQESDQTKQAKLRQNVVQGLKGKNG